MNGSIEWPDLETRGLVQVTLSRANLTTLLAGLDARHTGQPGIVSVQNDEDLVLVIKASE